VRLRILTINVQNDEGDPRRLDLLNRELRRIDPDVVALQEVISAGSRQQLDAGQIADAGRFRRGVEVARR
jgi:endonuclease/exonuclease/phosphatase family metal-dependent hydrolase